MSFLHFNLNYIQFIDQFLIDSTDLHYAFSITTKRKQNKKNNIKLLSREMDENRT